MMMGLLTLAVARWRGDADAAGLKGEDAKTE
jgi:hypothetical protein